MYQSVRRIWLLKSFAFGWPPNPSFPEPLFLLCNLFLQSRAVVDGFNNKSPNLLRIWRAVLSELWCPVCWCLFLVKLAFEQTWDKSFASGRFFEGNFRRGESRWGGGQGGKGNMSGDCFSVRTCRKHTEASYSPRAVALLMEHFSSGFCGLWVVGYPGLSTALYSGPWVEWDSVGTRKSVAQAGGAVTVHTELSPTARLQLEWMDGMDVVTRGEQLAL